MPRKLASIQKIEEVLPIDGADAIEKVKIKGWWCVAKKGEFKSGDMCVYFEIDSLLPNISQFSFLSKGSTLKTSITEDGTQVEGFRLKTVRLRGQISQGLALPLSMFPGISIELETDVTSFLNINKYEAPIPPELLGQMKGRFPGYIPKTGEDRIQSFPELLEKYRGQRFYITSKIDGESSTHFKYDGQFGVCGYNLEYIENPKTYLWELANRYNLKEKIPDGFAIQAEAAGEGLLKNRLKLKGIDLFIFYVINLKTWEYLKLDDMLLFAKELGVQTVPILENNFVLNHTCDKLLQMVNRPSPLNSSCLQEGMVLRLYNSTEKITFKVISNEYLLKHGL
jgi:RNA ligase (TIGR02306 family)